MRLVQGDNNPGQLASALAKAASVDPVGQPIRDRPGQQLRGRVDAGERGLVVEVAVVEVGEDRAQLVGGPADVDDDPVGVELRRAGRSRRRR